MIKAVLGAQMTADSIVRYQSTPAITANFVCHGTTFDYSCALDGFNYAQQLEKHGMFTEMAAFVYEHDIEYESNSFLQ